MRHTLTLLTVALLTHLTLTGCTEPPPAVEGQWRLQYSPEPCELDVNQHVVLFEISPELDAVEFLIAPAPVVESKLVVTDDGAELTWRDEVGRSWRVKLADHPTWSTRRDSQGSEVEYLRHWATADLTMTEGACTVRVPDVEELARWTVY